MSLDLAEIRHVLPIWIMLLWLLSACSGPTRQQAVSGSTANAQTSPLPTLMAIGNLHEYALPEAHSGMMRPTVDHRGRIWFGEMNNNYLTVFDPATHRFQQLTPPHGTHGIMGIAIASDDTVWFAEQYANYIGHYMPETGRFQTYDLPIISTPDPADKSKTLALPSAPNDIALDSKGNVWFTEMNADSLGILDVSTSQFKYYPLSAQSSVQMLNPYGIIVDAQGQVWFTQSSNSRLGHLDPHTGKMRFYTAPGPLAPLMEIANDTQKNIWITSFQSGLLLKFSAGSGTFTTYHAPSARSDTGGLYGLVITRDNTIWVTVSAENAIARLDQAHQQFIYYQLPTDSGAPFGITQAPDNSLWFTESLGNKLGQIIP
jgi:streptogramin lyase